MRSKQYLGPAMVRVKGRASWALGDTRGGRGPQHLMKAVGWYYAQWGFSAPFHTEEIEVRDFPGGLVVKNPPQMQGKWVLSLKIPRAAGHLSPCAKLLSPFSRVHKPQLLKPVHREPVVCNKPLQ